MVYNKYLISVNQLMYWIERERDGRNINIILGGSEMFVMCFHFVAKG